MGAVGQIPQHRALRLQLAAIAGTEPATSLFELRFRLASGGMGQDFIPIRELERAARSIVNRGQLTDVYIGAAPRVRRDGTAAAIERVWCAWADLDGRAAIERLRDFRPLPSIVIRTGSEDHAHVFWPLGSAVRPRFAQRANRRLALALGADAKATDPARILRPAGTFNQKHTPPRRVVCTRLELDTFTLDEVVGRLPDDRRYVPPPRPAGQPATGDPSNVIEGLARIVREAQIGNRNAALFWAACRVREQVDDRKLDDAEGRQALKDAALAAGLAEHETDRTLASALDTRVPA